MQPFGGGNTETPVSRMFMKRGQSKRSDKNLGMFTRHSFEGSKYLLRWGFTPKTTQSTSPEGVEGPLGITKTEHKHGRADIPGTVFIDEASLRQGLGKGSCEGLMVDFGSGTVHKRNPFDFWICLLGFYYFCLI